LSVSMWLKLIGPPVVDGLVMELDAVSTQAPNGFYVDPWASSGGQRFAVIETNGPGWFNGGYIPLPTRDVWHHYVFTFNRTTPAGANGYDLGTSAFMDGAPVTVTRDHAYMMSGTFSDKVLYFMSRACGSLFLSGEIAEVALWSDLLGPADAIALFHGGAGAPATQVRPEALLYYWPLCGTVAPEPATVGGIALEVMGAVASPHPIATCGAPPPPPSGLDHCRFRWSEPAVPDANLVGFNVYIGTEPGVLGTLAGFVAAPDPNGSASYGPTANFCAGKPDGTYYAVVRAVDTAGNESPASSEVAFVLSGAASVPPAPTALSVE
jgi:hypothetical protein